MGILNRALNFVSEMVRLGDGSYLSIVTDKPSYAAGEVVTGRVVAHINSPIVATSIVLKVSGKEAVLWDEERAETIWEGEGEERRSRTIYHHARYTNKHVLLSDLVIVSGLNHVLPPGEWQYPFSYPLRPDLPGCVKFARSDRPSDPEWHREGRSLETLFGVVYSFKAKLQNGASFMRDIRGKQEVVINAFFDWAKLRPAHAAVEGTVRFCCCIPRGKVNLVCDFDKAAYAGGEVAQIKAVIANASKNDVRSMKVKLVRSLQLNDGRGHYKSLTDVVARCDYPGVPSAATQTRDLPLPLRGGPGDYIPTTRGRHIAVTYDFQIVCDVRFCTDVQCAMPVTLYQPAPAVWGLQAALMPMQQQLQQPVYAPMQQQMPMQQMQQPNAPQQQQQQQPYYAGTPLQPQQQGGAFPHYGATSQGSIPPQMGASVKTASPEGSSGDPTVVNPVVQQQQQLQAWAPPMQV